MSNKSVVRNAQYKRGGLNKRERHNERKNADYMNEDIIPERAALNVHFKPSAGGYESTFDAMVADGIVSTRGRRHCNLFGEVPRLYVRPQGRRVPL